MRRIIITLTVLAAFLVSAVPANALLGGSPLEPGGAVVVDPKGDPVAVIDPKVDPLVVTVLKAGYSVVTDTCTGTISLLDPKDDPVAVVNPKVDPVLVTVLKDGYSIIDPKFDP